MGPTLREPFDSANQSAPKVLVSPVRALHEVARPSIVKWIPLPGEEISFHLIGYGVLGVCHVGWPMGLNGVDSELLINLNELELAFRRFLTSAISVGHRSEMRD